MKLKTNIIIVIILLFSFQTISNSQALLRGAEYRTVNSFLYGRFEASIKAPGKEGILTSLFTYFDGLPGDEWASSKWNEIDFEILGRYNNDVQLNTITPGSGNHVRHQYVNFNPAVDYHTYAFEWTPEYVAWFIDGEEVYRQTEDHISTLIRPQKFMMNIWRPGWSNWVGVWDNALLPAFGYYDWAAYYKHTPGTGNYGTGNNFTLDWRDEFDSFDNVRWEKAEHGFSGNQSSFVPENVVFLNGKLILCLTDKSVLGYGDKIKPSMMHIRADSETQLKIFFSEQIERTSAEKISNYIIPGVIINNATLLSDKRTVQLSVSGLNLGSPPGVMAKNILDLASPSNISDLHLRPMWVTKTFSFPLRINVGGDAYKDFISDSEFVTDTCNYGFMEGVKAGPFSDYILRTEDDTVYQTEINGLAKYILRLPNGMYRIKLLFAENFHTAVGKRVFDIYVQGNPVINNLDILKEAGAKTALEKIVENVEINNNLLDIHFAAKIERPLLNGIVVESLTSGSAKEEEIIPESFKLEQNYPNPFNPSTSIRYRLPRSGFVSLKVFDLLGSEIVSLVNQELSAGNYKVEFSTDHLTGSSPLSSGVYFYTLQTNNFAKTKKMLFLK